MKTWDDAKEIMCWIVRQKLRKTATRRTDAVWGKIANATWVPILEQVRDQVKLNIGDELVGWDYYE